MSKWLSECGMFVSHQMGSVLLLSVRRVREAVCSTPVLQTFTDIYRIRCARPAYHKHTTCIFRCKSLHSEFNIQCLMSLTDADSLREIQRSCMWVEKSHALSSFILSVWLKFVVTWIMVLPQKHECVLAWVILNSKHYSSTTLLCLCAKYVFISWWVYLRPKTFVFIRTNTWFHMQLLSEFKMQCIYMCYNTVMSFVGFFTCPFTVTLFTLTQNN